jgi:hypothetical protein
MAVAAYVVRTPERPGFVVSVALRFVTARLDTCHWGTGPTRLCRPQDSVRPRETALHRLATIAPCPTCRDDRDTSLASGLDGWRQPHYSEKRNRNIFQKAEILLDVTGKSFVAVFVP